MGDDSIRQAALERNTNETKIRVRLALDTTPETQVIKVSTGVGFLDHVRGRVC